jgi:3-dehydroquinate synthase
MHTVKVNLNKRSYKVIIGFNTINLLGQFLNKLNIGFDAYVITDYAIKNKYGKILDKILRQSGFTVKFKNIPDRENSKSLEMSFSILKDIAHYDFRRRIFIIAFGGGVVGDLAGFVASVYKRGIPYIQIPTTLLAQVDSSIGGKTGVDLPEGKNLVGSFYQPRIVLIDIKLLYSLNQRQIRSGLAEVIKYGIIKDKGLFSYLETKNRDILALDEKFLENIIKRSTQIKASLVSIDERDNKGFRTILNFGHTVGHAIEAAGNYRIYNHGEAIALGMLIASDISRRLRLINHATFERIEKLIRIFGLPVKIESISLSDIINAHYRDKKFIGKINRFVLIADIGKTKIVDNIPLDIIKESVKNRLSNITPT